MQKIAVEMKKTALFLLAEGSIDSIIAWQKGQFAYDNEPGFFSCAAELEKMIYDGFCGSNLSKYLARHGTIDAFTKNNNAGMSPASKHADTRKTLIFLKPCDTYSLNGLLAENQVLRGNIRAVGIGCVGHIDINKIRAKGFSGIIDIRENGDFLEIQTACGDGTCPRAETLLDKCLSCKGKEHKIFDELIGADLSEETAPKTIENERFSEVESIEAKTEDERFDFWRNHLSRCIRCNACRNICPVCICKKCVFDNTDSGVAAKVNVTDFEENLYHIIRAFHVAGRCSDCGECSRACPQNIPLHLLNRKHIKDINTFFGNFQAGETADCKSPLTEPAANISSAAFNV